MPKKVPAIFYLTDTTLSVQTEKAVILSLVLPHMDSDELVALLRSELAQLKNIVSEGVIVLGDGVLSQVVVAQDEDLKDAKKNLISSLPFEKKVAQLKEIPTAEKTYLLAANKKLYLSVITAAKSAEIVLQPVLPLSLFSDAHDEKTLDKKDVKNILTKTDLYNIGNFNEEEEVQNDIEEEVETIEERKIEETPETKANKQEAQTVIYEKEVSWNTSKLLLLLGFLMILTAGMGGLIYVQQSRDFVRKSADATPAVTATPTPTPAIVVKSELSVTIENGTGTPGQAGKVKELLEGIDFANVETGNADNTDHEKTEIVFSAKVPVKIQEEVKTLLLETFQAVTSKTDSSASVDILVITGEEK